MTDEQQPKKFVYSEIAPYFGSLFPCTDEHKKLFSEVLPNPPTGATVLDIGFGTGEHIAHLKETGAAVRGIEYSQELVDHAAVRLGLDTATQRDLRLGDMVVCDTVFPELVGSTDVVMNIGNTLPHARTRSDVAKCICAMARLLKPHGKGTLVIQNVNYDRIIAKKITELPTIQSNLGNGRPFKFTRHYDIGGLPESVVFSTSLERPNADPIRGKHSLLALTRAELEAMVVAAGLNVTRVLGDFDGEPWSQSTFCTIIVATN